MSTERDVTRIVRSWLRTDEYESADRVLATVLTLVDTTPQRRPSWPARRASHMNKVTTLALAIAAVVVVAVVGVIVLPSVHVTGGGPSPTASTSPRPGELRKSYPLPSSGAIDAGRYFSAQPRTLVQVTLPSGWSTVSADAGTPSRPQTVRRPSSGESRGFLDVSLGHDVKQVATDICVGLDQEQYVDVGPTAGDLASALEAQIAHRPTEALADPSDVTVGGYPARKFVLTYPIECPGPEGRYIWTHGSPGAGEGVLKNGTTTIYIVDVDGDRQVISSSHRAATGDDLAELDAIIGSIEIEPAGVDPTVGRGPQGGVPMSLTIEGIPLSFTVPEGIHADAFDVGGWERFGSISLNRSRHGPQDAEGIIYWTGFPDGAYAERCGPFSSVPDASSIADVAAAVATAPGTELLTGPMDVTVGGYPATSMVVTVRDDLGCDPGYFYAWDDARVGAFWPATHVGDRIRVWIVDVDGTRLFIAGETRSDVMPGVPLTEADRSELEREMQQIVDSIQFE